MFRRVFDHSPESKEVGECLLALRQGPLRVFKFALEFRTIAAESGWNDDALKVVQTSRFEP